MRFVCIPLLFLALQGTAFTQERINYEQLKTLIDCGFEDDAILASITKDGVILDLADAEWTKLENDRVSPKLLGALRERAKTTTKRRLTVQAVLDLWSQGATEETLLTRVRESGAAMLLSVDDVLKLSRAGVPASVVRAMRLTQPTPRSKEPPMTREEILRLTTAGTPAADILRRLRDGDSVFQLTAEDVIDLNRRGVDREVLKEMYRRNAKPTEETPAGAVNKEESPAAGPTSRPVEKDASEPKPIELALYQERGAGFSMLYPAGFRVAKEFKGRKTLLQFQSPSAGGDLPEVEISVLLARPKEEDSAYLSKSNLKSVAMQFTTGLRESYKKDGILFASQEPRPTYISGADAVRTATTATAPDGTGHTGMSVLFFGANSVVAVSTSCRIEISDEWKDTLEQCVRSFVLEGLTRPDTPLADADQTAAAKKTLDAWKTSLARFDFTAFSALHVTPADTIEQRRKFVRTAVEFQTKDARVEFASLDPASRRLSYNVFTMDGRRRETLEVEKKADEWRLASKPASETKTK